jgi:hypothetical protein
VKNNKQFVLNTNFVTKIKKPLVLLRKVRTAILTANRADSKNVLATSVVKRHAVLCGEGMHKFNFCNTFNKKNGGPYSIPSRNDTKLKVFIHVNFILIMNNLRPYHRQSAIRLRTAGFQVEAVGPAADQLATAVALSLLALCLYQLVRN